jgi:uncharacterized protein YbcC (UPF0753/DUF2309 family)
MQSQNVPILGKGIVTITHGKRQRYHLDRKIKSHWITLIEADEKRVNSYRYGKWSKKRS